MKLSLKAIDSFLYDDLIFSSRYRVWKHVLYWLVHINLSAVFWMIMNPVEVPYLQTLWMILSWVPVFILFSYPFVYWAIPDLLLKGKVLQFLILILGWGAVGLLINPRPAYFLWMTTSAASPMIIKFFKLWTSRQKNWMQAQHEKITTELQLLKAQVHPHFLFNTLNNIYSFSLENSPKTPDMIAKLSSLLGYMLNDCKAEEVRLEKEIEIMRNYIDLEKERYGNTIDIEWNIEGDIKDKFISPLLLVPFLENAFKHGMSEQIGKASLRVDISAVRQILRCKITNSKNEFKAYSSNGNGIGIENVKKRLVLMYPDNYNLEMRDEGRFFAVSLRVNLAGFVHTSPTLSPALTQPVLA